MIKRRRGRGGIEGALRGIYSAIFKLESEMSLVVHIKLFYLDIYRCLFKTLYNFHPMIQYTYYMHKAKKKREKGQKT